MSARHDPILPKDASGSSFTDPPALPPASVQLDPLEWLRRFLAANPFYLASLVALLYGIHRVSSGTGFLQSEVQQLFFKFTSLQFYELALVGLAVFLARRRVWYDAALLVLLENVVLIVPFILVTQASLIQQHWTGWFCVAGVSLAAARLAWLKRRFGDLNLPWRALAVGGVLLLLNAILPIVYRHLQEERMGKTITWGPAYEMNEWSWLVILPLMAACAFLLPPARRLGPLWPQRRWLPLALFWVWILASTVHLYALRYVYTFEMRAGLWAPTLLVLSWVVQHRVSDLVESPGRPLRIALLLIPFPLAFMALLSGDGTVVLGLAAVNTIRYGRLAALGHHPRLTGQLCLASGAGAAVCALAHFSDSGPMNVLPPVGWPWVVATYLVMTCLLSRRLGLGLLGAVAVGVSLGTWLPSLAALPYEAIHGALLFLLLHSLRWEDAAEPAARAVRWAAGAFWAGHALVWAAAGGPFGSIAGIGLGVLLTWMTVWWTQGGRPPVAVGLSAAAVTLSAPVVRAFRWAEAAPAGVVAIAASFLFLAAGTSLALTKRHWASRSES